MSPTNYSPPSTVLFDVPEVRSDETQLGFNIELELDAIEAQIGEHPTFAVSKNA